MYLQITTRCNMKCRHCCYSCTAKGEDMTREVAVAACRLAYERGDMVTIGGGEPTVHPLFWDFLGIVLGNDADTGVSPHVITNGKRADDAVALARLARRGVIGAELSRDAWHEPVEERVVKAFERKDRGYFGDRSDDLRGIRSVRRICKKGRAAKWGDSDDCCCDDLLVDPQGRIWECGCKKRQFGTVFDPAIPDDYQPGEDCTTKKEAARAADEVPA